MQNKKKKLPQSQNDLLKQWETFNKMVTKYTSGDG